MKPMKKSAMKSERKYYAEQAYLKHWPKRSKRALHAFTNMIIEKYVRKYGKAGLKSFSKGFE